MGIICVGMPVEVHRVGNGIEIAVFSDYFCEVSGGIVRSGMSLQVHRVCNGIEIASTTLLLRTFCPALTHAVRIKMFRNRIEICVS